VRIAQYTLGQRVFFSRGLWDINNTTKLHNISYCERNLVDECLIRNLLLNFLRFKMRIFYEFLTQNNFCKFSWFLRILLKFEL